MNYKIELTAQARDALAHAPTNQRMVVFKRILQLGKDPEKQGKALLGDLAGCRSIRAGGRYRVVFTVIRGRVLVVVIAVGMRKEGDQRDIYRLAKKLFRNFLEEKK